MPENTNLLAGYQEAIDKRTDARVKHNLMPDFKANPVYERALDLMTTDPPAFEALKLSPTLKIELGLYIRHKEHSQALEEAAGGA